MCKKFEDMFSRLDRIPACDGRTDGHTSCYGIVRAMHTSRGKNDKKLSCRREAARRSETLKILLSYWRSFKVIENGTIR